MGLLALFQESLLEYCLGYICSVTKIFLLHAWAKLTGLKAKNKAYFLLSRKTLGVTRGVSIRIDPVADLQKWPKLQPQIGRNFTATTNSNG